MMRWTIFAIALAVAGCTERQRDRLADEASSATADVDTALRADTGATETGATVPGRPATGGARGPTGAEAMGGTRGATTPADLSTDQVRRLQTALNNSGCNAGAVDGVVGPRTRQAITCALDKNNLGRNDFGGLYRALDLNF